MKTILCERLGIQYPIFQGAMAWISDGKLAAAVSEAGGLGIIAGGSAPPEVIRREIQVLRGLTDKPFGVNVMLMSPYVAEVAELVAEERVPVVTTGAGKPSPYMEMWKQAGIVVIPVVPSVRIAQSMERAGADAVIAEGTESGGHIGDVSTMTLVPQVCDAVNIPVIAAGGIGDGRGLAAALMLGAVGVQMGTRFLVASECGIPDGYKARVLNAADTDTLVTGRRLGHPVRSLKSPFSQRFFELEHDPSVSDKALEAMGEGALRSAAERADAENGSFMAGQISGLVRHEQCAADILEDVMSGAEAVLKKRYKAVLSANLE